MAYHPNSCHWQQMVMPSLWKGCVSFPVSSQPLGLKTGDASRDCGMHHWRGVCSACQRSWFHFECGQSLQFCRQLLHGLDDRHTHDVSSSESRMGQKCSIPHCCCRPTLGLVHPLEHQASATCISVQSPCQLRSWLQLTLHHRWRFQLSSVFWSAIKWECCWWKWGWRILSI